MRSVRPSPAAREEALGADVVVTVTPGHELLFPRGEPPSRPALPDGRRRPRQGRDRASRSWRAWRGRRGLSATTGSRRARRRHRRTRSRRAARTRRRRDSSAACSRRGAGPPLGRRHHRLRLDRASRSRTSRSRSPRCGARRRRAGRRPDARALTRSPGSRDRDRGAAEQMQPAPSRPARPALPGRTARGSGGAFAEDRARDQVAGQRTRSRSRARSTRRRPTRGPRPARARRAGRSSGDVPQIPAQRCVTRGPPADELGRELLDALLDHRRRLLDGGPLAAEARVPPAADHEAAVWQLLPVIEPVARVMGTRIEHAGRAAP